jgi:hypothetical protein
MEASTHKPPPTGSYARPFSVTLLTLGVLSMAVINLLGFVQAILNWELYSDILPIPLTYLALSDLIWGLAGLPLVWGLWLGRVWAVRFTLLFVLVYTLYYWLNRLLLLANAGGSNWPFAVITNSILIIIIYWILNRPRARAFFGETNDR